MLRNSYPSRFCYTESAPRSINADLTMCEADIDELLNDRWVGYARAAFGGAKASCALCECADR